MLQLAPGWRGFYCQWLVCWHRPIDNEVKKDYKRTSHTHTYLRMNHWCLFSGYRLVWPVLFFFQPLLGFSTKYGCCSCPGSILTIVWMERSVASWTLDLTVSRWSRWTGANNNFSMVWQFTVCTGCTQLKCDTCHIAEWTLHSPTNFLSGHSFWLELPFKQPLPFLSQQMDYQSSRHTVLVSSINLLPFCQTKFESIFKVMCQVWQPFVFIVLWSRGEGGQGGKIFILFFIQVTYMWKSI